MKNIFLNIISAILLAFAIIGCSEMNDKHEVFLADGEIIYTGKVDSILVFPGDQRVQLRFWASDPRVKSVGFFWNPDDDSLMQTINKVSPIDSFEVAIGGEASTKKIKEGNYTLKVITYDNVGHSSIPYEKRMTVYGDRYRSSLTNRVVNSMNYSSKTGELSLFLSGPINDEDMGVEILYTDRDGVINNLELANSEITSPVTISNVNVSKEVSLRTVYLPEPSAIDAFITSYKPIEIIEVVNVALNKPVRTSGNYNASLIGPNAVDGVISEASRWLSARSGEHWIEIDLQEEYAINGMNTWTGSGGFNSPTANFFLQAEINGEWVNVLEVTGNSDPQYSASFPEISTSKVRYFVPEYAGNMVRLFEIEILATIKY